jgi:hypothetical protein
VAIAAASAWWEQNRMDAQQDQIYEAACSDGTSYVIVDWDVQTAGPRWTLNRQFDGTQGVRVYRDPNTNQVVFAAKRWQVYAPFDKTINGRTRMNLYFPDRVEKWISASGSNPGIAGLSWEMYEGEGDKGGIVVWTDGAGEPLGCAVVPFENPGGSEIVGAISLQDMLNKADLDLVAATDSAGFRILYMTGVALKTNTAGAVDDVTLGPGKVVKLQDPAARFGAIDPVDPALLIASCHYWLTSIAGATRTPQFLLTALGADQPSGESLKNQEIGLVAKCERKQEVWGNSWEDVVYLSQKLAALNGASISPVRLQAQWKPAAQQEDPEVVEARRAQTRKLGVDAQIPLVTILRREGWTEEELQQLEKDKAAESRAVKQTLGAALAAAQREFDQGGSQNAGGNDGGPTE